MNIVQYIPLPIRIILSHFRELNGIKSIFGKYSICGLYTYVSYSVKARNWEHVDLRRGAQVHRGTHFHTNYTSKIKYIVIGERTYIGQNCYFSAGELIEIKSDCLIGASCNFLGAGHQYSSPTISYAFAPVISYGKIILGTNTWVGVGSTILGNVEVGFGSIIAAGTMLRFSVPPLCFVAGNPAKVVKAFNWITKEWINLPESQPEKKVALEKHAALLPTEKDFTEQLKFRP